MQYQVYCVGTCTLLYFGFPEDGASALKHVGILYGVYDSSRFMYIYWLL
jgi:hypothetical protein